MSIRESAARVGAWLGKVLPFNRGNLKTQLGVLAFIVVFVTLLSLATCSKASADDSVVFSYGRTIARGETDVLDIALDLPGRVDRIGYQLGVTLIGNSEYGTDLVQAPSPCCKLILHPTFVELPRRQPTQFGVRAQIVPKVGPVTAGLGVIYLQNVDDFNGSHLNFCLSLGYEWRHLQARYLHISNAGSRSPNTGRDMVLIGWAFR